MATTHLIRGAVHPLSELKSVSDILENSAISEIPGIDKVKLIKDLLYSI
jgi:hypothetical protein